MVQGASIIDDWIAEGEARGEARGRVAEARHIALRFLRKRFREVPAALVDRVERADVEACEALMDRALEVEALQDLRTPWTD